MPGGMKGMSHFRFIDLFARIGGMRIPFETFLLGNVKQLTLHDRGRTFSVIQSPLPNRGYTVYYEILNALDFGLPQKRERVFIVGFREPIAFKDS